jgi:hypothetical protein
MDGEALSLTGIKNHHSIATIVLEEAAPSLFYVTVEPHKLKFGSPIDFPEISCKGTCRTECSVPRRGF